MQTAWINWIVGCPKGLAAIVDVCVSDIATYTFQRKVGIDVDDGVVADLDTF